jgi:hypothetical protein
MKTSGISRSTGRTRRLLLQILFLLMFALGFFPSAYPAVKAQKVLRGETVPRKNLKTGSEYKSWSLFLVCNPQWLAAEKASDLNDLYLSFGNFGAAIGDDNLALWFSKATKDADVGKSIDVEESSSYCRRWGLTPSRSPYLVVTTTYPGYSYEIASPAPPDLTLEPPRLIARIAAPSPAPAGAPSTTAPFEGMLPENSAVFELGTMNPVEIHKLLAGLTDDLVRNKKVTAHQAQPLPVKQPAGLFVRILEAVQDTMNNFACSWHFKVNAGLVQADLQACHTRIG